LWDTTTSLQYSYAYLKFKRLFQAEQWRAGAHLLKFYRPIEAGEG
jgi:hypothetical protein